MADFANKQKSFIEKMSEELSASESEAMAGESAPLVEEKLYDCVICNQNTPSTDEKPMGLVALLQSTSGGYRIFSKYGPDVN